MAFALIGVLLCDLLTVCNLKLVVEFATFSVVSCIIFGLHPIVTIPLRPDFGGVTQKLNDKEMARAAAREEQEMIDFKKALELQKQLDEREETYNIDWNTVAKQVEERQSDTIKRYQTLKKKPVSVAQARKNMMIYLKTRWLIQVGLLQGSTSSHHFGTNVAEAEVDSLIRSSALVMTTITIATPTVDTVAAAKEKPIEPLLFGAASLSAGGTNPTPGGFSDLTDSDFIIGGIRTVISPDTDLQKVMEHDQLFKEFNVSDARQMSLNVKVRMRAEYNIREKRRLKSIAEDRVELLKVREKEVEDLKVQLLLKEAEAAEAIRLRAGSSKIRSSMGKDRELTDLNAQFTFVKSYNDSLVDQRLEEFQDAQLKIVNDKLHADFVEMALHLEEKFSLHLLTTIYGPAIGKAIEKGIANGLAMLQDVNFSLLADLKSNKDASVETNFYAAMDARIPVGYEKRCEDEEKGMISVPG
ncbi:hypothetical protein Tco_1569509 [Tanacetum coccineum]